MTKSTLSLAIGAALAALASGASAQTMYGDVARVISASPITERIPTSRRECHTEEVSALEERRMPGSGELEYRPRPEVTGAGAVVGAIIGGVIGHQFGHSQRGQNQGTAAGAVIGGLIGNSIERDAQAGYRPAVNEVYVERVPVTREVERCNEIADARERIVGYDVRYEYNGREFRTRMPYDPGPEMAVNVDVRPPLARSGPAPARPIYKGPY